MSKAQLLANLDHAEGGFDALMQAMVCKVSLFSITITLICQSTRDYIERNFNVVQP